MSPLGTQRHQFGAHAGVFHMDAGNVLLRRQPTGIAHLHDLLLLQHQVQRLTGNALIGLHQIALHKQRLDARCQFNPVLPDAALCGFGIQRGNVSPETAFA